MATAKDTRLASWPRILGILAGAYLLYLLVASLLSARSAEEAGYVVGFILAAFVLAAVARFLYVRLSSAEPKPSFWSLWILVITAVLVIVARFALSAGSS